ncbi:MAG: glycosyl hydrolase [Limisphaerales bacterium]
MESGFLNPPASARPWVYWFWLNGNLTSNGITADLEAMQRADIGGVLIMEVDQGAPKGQAPFGSPVWRKLFQHVCAEAHRLGLQVNMNNDAGWCGSGGPWITPELSMQKVVWSETNVDGPCHFEAALREPEKAANYYEDIAVLAFPTPAGSARLEAAQAKAAFTPDFVAPQAQFPAIPAEQTVPVEKVIDLTSKLGAGGHLDWQAPAGQWTILRFGHTSTGVENHPAPEAGLGLETDKLSQKATEAMFNGLMGKVIADSKPLAGKSLVRTHIDSWETGSQNWTPRFREEFRARRGYDLQPFLPALTGRIVGSAEISERFLWDVRQTVSDLLLENYAGCFRKLAHQHGISLSIEAYSTCPTEELAYAGEADEPMGEFWSWPKYMEAFSCTEMTSAGHVYGKKIVGAESFTAMDSEKWQGYPGNIKDLGDWAFCEGINRFVFHRYAMQPWTQNVRPGMAMGPWGLHYERTETWWEQSAAWHQYLARCQFLLQQGLFVADLCLLSPEGSPQTIDRQESFISKLPGEGGQPLDRPGHNFDICPPEVVLHRMSVRDGKLVLPDGMSYRLLALPQCDTMTPALLRKIKELVQEGATVAGARPVQSPSLSGYPACDTELTSLADELWGTNEITEEVAERSYGKGRVLCGTLFDQARALNRHRPSELGTAKWIWFNEGNPAIAAPVGPRYFRKQVKIEGGAMKSAQLIMTADNSFQCWINGQPAGQGDDFNRLYHADVARLLQAGSNLVTVTGVNGGEQPNPAGIIGALTIKFQNGRTVFIPTDASWEAAADNNSVNTWSSALELGTVGMAPWGDPGKADAGRNLYPDLEFLGQLLTQRGLPEDFSYIAQSGEHCLRFIHKRIGKTDLYFVANKTPRPQEVSCSFRVSGKRPELLWPERGEIQRAAQYEAGTGGTRMPLRLEACDSVFVVFRDRAEADQIVSATRDGAPAWAELDRTSRHKLTACVGQAGHYALSAAGGEKAQFDVAPLPPPLPIEGPWKVEFAKGMGGPAQASFQNLSSWSDQADPAIKYFSGTATYTRTFAAPGEMLGNGRRLFLDLGKVAVIADVSLNGQKLGTLWKAPYRVEITSALKPGENTLSVKVANLWINRQIGDELLPEDSERNANGTLKQWPEWLQNGGVSPTGRETFSSWRLWKRNDPLRESGLLGPVRIVSTQSVQIKSGDFH